MSTGFTVLASVGCVMYLRMETNRIEQERLARQDRSVGKAAVGGPFKLTDQEGRPFSERHLAGEFTLLYFGFTHCPDICPDEMEKMAAAVDLVEKQSGHQVTPLFITVDPQRDKVPQVKSYVKEFHPRMVGLTGSPEAITALCKAYRVYFSKTDDSPDDYLLDHSIIMYLLNPEATFQTFYGKNFNAQQLADSMCEHISQWKKTHADYPKKPLGAI